MTTVFCLVGNMVIGLEGSCQGLEENSGAGAGGGADRGSHSGGGSRTAVRDRNPAGFPRSAPAPAPAPEFVIKLELAESNTIIYLRFMTYAASKHAFHHGHG